MTAEFNPVAVGDKIAEHLAEAEKAIGICHERSKAAGVLLLDVAQNHPKHMEPIRIRLGLGDSRRKELLMIAGGRRTLEESRAEPAKRQARFKAKTGRYHPPVTASRGTVWTPMRVPPP
jgi:hypothetical protein